MVNANAKFYQWYRDTFPWDDILDEYTGLDEELTMQDALDHFNSGKDIYDIIPGDSVYRERVFEAFAELTGKSYEDIYESWMSHDYPEEEIVLPYEASMNKSHRGKSMGIKKKVYENDEMMDIFVAHAKFDGGYDFDRSSSIVECKLRDGFSSNDHKWNDARLYMELVGVDHYIMGIDFNGNNYQTAEQLIDNGNGETIGDTMSELLSYAQFHGSSHERWSTRKSKVLMKFNSMVKQRRYSIKKSVQSELAEELVGYFGEMDGPDMDWIDKNMDLLHERMSENRHYGLCSWLDDACDEMYEEGYDSCADTFDSINVAIQSCNESEISEILDVFRYANSWYDIYNELQDVE